MSIALSNTSAAALYHLEACLVAELGAVLSSLETSWQASPYSQTISLPDLAATWRSADRPADWGDPGCGLHIESSAVVEYDGLGAYDTEHEIVCSILLSEGVVGSVSLDEYHDAHRLYAHAVTYTLQRYGVSDTYAGQCGVYRVQPVSVVPAIVLEGEDPSQYMTYTECRLLATQRIRGYAIT